MPGLGDKFPYQFPMLMSGLNNTMTQSPEQQQIAQMMAAFQQQIENQPRPQMEQVPNAPNPFMAFLAQALGNVGSAVAQTPLYSQQVFNTLEGSREAKGGAEQRNFERNRMYELDKQKALLDLAGKRVELKLSQLGEGKISEQQKLENQRAAIKRHQDDIKYLRDIEAARQKHQDKMDEEAQRQEGYGGGKSGGGRNGGGKTAKLTPSQIEIRSKAVADKLVKPDLFGNIDQERYAEVQDSVRTELEHKYNTEGVKPPDKTEQTKVGKTSVGDLKEIGRTMLNGKKYAGLKGPEKLNQIHRDIESMRNLSPEAKAWAKKYVSLLSRGK